MRVRRPLLIVLCVLGVACTAPVVVEIPDAAPVVDAGEVDAGAPDAGEVDAGEIDAGEIDAGEIDAGEVDAGELDAGEVDAGGPDAGTCGEVEPPSGVSGIARNAGVSLRWTSAAVECGGPVFSYEVRVSPGDDVRATSAGSETQLLIDGLTNGVTYTFHVRTIVARGASVEVASEPLTPFTVPDAPEAFVVTGGQGAAQLAWQAPAFDGGSVITGYVVRRAVGRGPLVELVRVDASTLAFADTGLADGLVYTYVVAAVNAAGDGAGATAQALTRPGAPENVQVQVDGTYATVFWDAVTGADRYLLARSVDAGATWTDVATGTDVALQDSSLPAGTHLQWTVRASNASGLGPASQPVEGVSAPPPPTGLTATARAGTSGLPEVALSWTAAPTAAEYVVCRFLGFQLVVLGRTATTTWVDTEVSGSTDYSYTVYSVSPSGQSPESAPAPVRTTALPPLAPSLASPSLTNVTSASLTIGSCLGRTHVLVNESTAPAATSTGWIPCTTGAGGIPASFASSPQGSRTLHVWAKDRFGKVEGPSDVTLRLDSVVPAIVLPSVTGPFKGGASYTFTFTVSEQNPGDSGTCTVERTSNDGAEWTTVATLPTGSSPLASAPLSTAFAWPASDALATRLRVTMTDAAGNTTTTETANVVVDGTPPALVEGGFTINGGATTTSDRHLLVGLRGTDSATPIDAFCLKSDAATPTAGDACFRPLAAPTRTLQLVDAPFDAGLLSGRYTVYGFVRDAVGHVSVRAAAGCTTSAGTDCATISVDSPEPPRITSVFATATDAPAATPTVTDLLVPAGAPVIVKWEASLASGTLPADAVTLAWSADETTYTTIATGLPNAAGTGCTLTGTQTGCYAWTTPGSPSDAPFRVRIQVTTSERVTSTASAPTNNVSLLRVLAGNTDPGLGASGKAAVFFNSMLDADEDPGSFVRASDGTWYFRDANRGLLVVRPDDGLVRLLIPTTGTASVDGPVSSATLRSPLRLAIDPQDRVLVLDFDRIRRYDPVAGTFTTLIGGGTSALDGVTGREVQVLSQPATLFRSKAVVFTVLPDGDVVFQDKSTVTPANGWRVRIWDSDTDRVRSIVPNGLGIGAFPTQDVAQCFFAGTVLAFDPATSTPTYLAAQAYNSCGSGWANFEPSTGLTRSPPMPGASLASWITGLDGRAYIFSVTHGYITDNRIERLDPVTNTLVPLVGTGANGSCPDGTLPLQCDLNPRDLFVAKDGQLFFMDRNRLRTVDPATGRVVTLLGQGLAYGDGGPALAARFGSTASLELLDSGDVIVGDSKEKRFRQFTPGGTVRTIAGNGTDGSIDVTKPAIAQPAYFGGYWFTDDAACDPATGAILLPTPSRLARLNRTTGLWDNFVGPTGTILSAADGLPGRSIAFGSTNARSLGFDGRRHLVVVHGSSGGPFYKLYDTTDGTQSSLMGVNGTEGGVTYCADGTAGTACPVPGAGRATHTHASYDAFSTRWVLMTTGTTAVRSITPGGNIGTITTLATAARNFVYRHDATTETVHYCAASDQRLHKKDLRAGTDVALPWPVPSMHCVGRAMLYDPRRNSLVFPFEQNQLFGVAEYLAP